MEPCKHLFLWILLLLPLLLSAGAAISLPVEPSARFTRLSIDEGLTQSTVYSVAQDRRGLIYLGTQRGVVRFDGYRFVDIDPGGSLDVVVSDLLVADADTLLIGTFSVGLARLSLSTGQIEWLGGGAGGLRSREICALVSAGPGRVWVGSAAGVDLLDIESGRATAIDLPAIGPVCAMVATDDGLWAGAGGLVHYSMATHRVDRLLGGGPSDLLPDEVGFEEAGFDEAGFEEVDFGNVYALLRDPAGRFYLGTDHGLIRVQKDGSHSRFATETPVVSLVLDGSGLLWLGTLDGVLRFDPSTEQLQPFRDGPNGAVLSLLEDASGLLWFGTRTEGALRYDPGQEAFRGLAEATDDRLGLSHPVVWALYRERDGTLFVATGAGLDRFDGQTGARTNYSRGSPDGSGLSTDFPTALHRRGNGTLLVGGMAGQVDSLDIAKGRVEPLGILASPEPGAPADYLPIRALLEDHRGEVWAASLRGGLARWSPSSETGFESVPAPQTRFAMAMRDGSDPPPVVELPVGSKRIAAMVEDDRGTLWLATGAGLHAMSPDRATYTILRHGATSHDWMDGELLAMSPGSHGRLWLGTHLGELASFDPQTLAGIPVPWRHGRPDLARLSVYSIVEDSRGRLWLGTNGGVVRVDPDTGSVRRFDTRNGLLNPELNAGAWFYDPSSDELMLGGTRGVDLFRPGALDVPARSAPIVLTAIRSANRHLRPEIVAPAIEAIELEYQDRDVLFELATVDFRDPRKHRYSYRLDGQDEEWIEAGTRRVAAYSNLAGGDYVFRVRNTAGVGEPSDDGLRLRVRVIPPFWQTSLFRFTVGGLSAATLLLLPVAWYRRRLAAVARRHAEQTEARRRLLAAREQERIRLARDLHDGPLQDLSGLRLQLGQARRRPGLDRESKRSESLDQVDRVSSELRHICRELRPPALMERGLAAAIEAHLSAFSETHPEIELEVDLMADSQVVVTRERVQLFRIFQEALANIVKHANASWIAVRLEIDAEGDVFEIQDDGVGFVVPERLIELGRQERYGLLGMAERAELIGGRLEVCSHPGAGTQVTIDVPATRAFPPASERAEELSISKKKAARAVEVLHV